MTHMKTLSALDLIPQVAKDFEEIFHRDSGGLIREYHCEGAETVVIALGSVLGTIKDVIDDQRDAGVSIGALGIISYRPFPFDAVRKALLHAKRVVIVEKALAVGIGGIVAQDIRRALSGLAIAQYTVIAGLGGRPITKASLDDLFDLAVVDDIRALTFLDLDQELVDAEMKREAGR